MYKSYKPMTQSRIDAVVRRIKTKDHAMYIRLFFQNTDLAWLGVLASDLVIGDTFTSKLDQFTREVDRYKREKLKRGESSERISEVMKALKEALGKDKYTEVEQRVIPPPVLASEYDDPDEEMLMDHALRYLATMAPRNNDEEECKEDDDDGEKDQNKGNCCAGETQVRSDEKAQVRSDEKAHVRSDEKAHVHSDEKAHVRSDENAHVRSNEKAQVKSKEQKEQVPTKKNKDPVSIDQAKCAVEEDDDDIEIAVEDENEPNHNPPDQKVSDEEDFEDDMCHNAYLHRLEDERQDVHENKDDEDSCNSDDFTLEDPSDEEPTSKRTKYFDLEAVVDP